MDFKELVETNVRINDVEVIKMLKESAYPVILYGATPDIADQIVKKLAENQISIALVAVDDDSRQMLSSTRLLKQAKTERVEDVDEKLPCYHVVLGYVKGYNQIDSILPKFRNALSVSYLSEIFDMELITPSFVSEHSEFLENFYENLQDQQIGRAHV
jgi:hypothetical protein